ncbi:MAG: glutamate racemase [Candidatus Muiribacteriaceae bacterium]
MAKIGIFDSGLGGLSVANKIINETSGHSIIYLGDTARVPYGSKSIEKIKEFSENAFDFLISEDVDIIIVACNTVSSVALPFLRNSYSIPVIGVVESGVKAAYETGYKNIGIIGTHNTINSGRYEFLLKELDNGITIFRKACPLFVPLVEEGEVNSKITELVVEKYLAEFKDHIDVLILACTHYPALARKISEFFEGRVHLVDASMKIVEYINRYLDKKEKDSREFYYVTDRPDNFTSLSRLFLSKNIDEAKIISLS